MLGITILVKLLYWNAYVFILVNPLGNVTLVNFASSNAKLLIVVVVESTVYDVSVFPPGYVIVYKLLFNFNTPLRYCKVFLFNFIKI